MKRARLVLVTVGAVLMGVPIAIPGAASQASPPLMLARIQQPPPPAPPVVQPAPAASSPVAPPLTLENRDWRAMRIGDRVLGPKDTLNPVTLMLDAPTSRASGASGCNRFSGAYQTRGNTLTFGALGATRLTCPSGMDIESAYLQALQGVRRWRIVTTQLELLNQAGIRMVVLETATSR